MTKFAMVETMSEVFGIEMKNLKPDKAPSTGVAR
jgi:hypothetical protein